MEGDRVSTADALILVLLDATRADRFGRWGNIARPTPCLDALAAEGVAFRRHFVNAHATRSSFPQLMTGRYFHQNILRSFMPAEDPREFPFTRPDPTAVLLPALLRRHGFQTLGISAHPWVVAESPLGQQFDRFDFIPVEASRGHADAPEVVDRALELWRTRDQHRPVFLYLHFMDMHMPRFLPEGEPRFPVPGFAWRERFDPAGEPLFNRALRRWSPIDARDFTELDRRHFAAVYDTRLSYTDEHLGRLLAAVRDRDPGLSRTLIAVIADHGEELGEEGRTGHSGSLADGVQHVPWIMAGGGVGARQEVERLSENIDVAPTLLALLGLSPPPGIRMDGRAQLGRDGVLLARHGQSAAYYAWEEYRAIRTRRYLLRQELPDSLRARCHGRERLYRMGRGVRVTLDIDQHAELAARLRERLARRLDTRQQVFLAGRYDQPATAFLVRADLWQLGPGAAVGCMPLDGAPDRRRLRSRGWVWSGRGVTVLRPDGGHPLPVTLPAPDGEYRVDAAAVRVEPAPWVFGYARWLRRSFLRREPLDYLPLGSFRSSGGRLKLTIPGSAGVGRHITALRLLPAGAAEEMPAPGATGEEADLHRRLQALGYVE